jgi:hypothetical protein
MPKRIARALVVGSLIATLAVPVGAADAAPALTRGVKVRLTTLDHSRVEGYLLEADRERLRIRVREGAQRSLPLSELVSVEVARRNGRARGAGRGALAGALLMSFVVMLESDGDQLATRSLDGKTCSSPNPFGGTDKYKCTTGWDVVAVIAGGAAIGSFIGLWKTGERYVAVDPLRAAVTVVPVPTGIAVRATVRF